MSEDFEMNELHEMAAGLLATNPITAKFADQVADAPTPTAVAAATALALLEVEKQLQVLQAAIRPGDDA